jgi:hypothetical protein
MRPPQLAASRFLAGPFLVLCLHQLFEMHPVTLGVMRVCSLLNSRTKIRYWPDSKPATGGQITGRLARKVRFGSKADMAASDLDVRFTPESGHVRRNVGCPLRANSGHREHRALRKEWAQVRFSANYEVQA